jgi:hypothetical protein
MHCGVELFFLDCELAFEQGWMAYMSGIVLIVLGRVFWYEDSRGSNGVIQDYLLGSIG